MTLFGTLFVVCVFSCLCHFQLLSEELVALGADTRLRAKDGKCVFDIPPSPLLADNQAPKLTAQQARAAIEKAVKKGMELREERGKIM